MVSLLEGKELSRNLASNASPKKIFVAENTLKKPCTLINMLTRRKPCSYVKFISCKTNKTLKIAFFLSYKLFNFFQREISKLSVETLLKTLSSSHLLMQGTAFRSFFFSIRRLTSTLAFLHLLAKVHKNLRNTSQFSLW